MIFINKVLIFMFAIQWCDKVKCMPRYRIKNVEKRFHVAVSALPAKHITFIVEKIPHSERYAHKHGIHKRQVAPSDVYPASNEIPVVAIEEVVKAPDEETIKNNEKHLIPKVLIASIVKPVEDGKLFSFVLPVKSEVFIIPADKGGEIIKESSNEVNVISEPILKPDEVVALPDPVLEIASKPIEVPPPIEPIAKDVVVINTPIKDTVPPIGEEPIVPNLNGPSASSVVQNIPDKTLLYTDIVSQIPLSDVQYPSPPVVPVPEIMVPPPPPPVKAPPIIKEETPNFFVKGSRLVLYFGSVMLQMLSKLVNGGINLNQPLHPVLPGIV